MIMLKIFVDSIKERLNSWMSSRYVMTSCGYKKYYKLHVCGNKLKLGRDVYIGSNATILCTFNNVEIADHVVIGPNLTIVENNHIFNVVGKYIKDCGLTKDGGVKIETDCWIGANVTILAGVTIGRGCVIGACSCVTRSLPPYSIAVGTPARVVKRRFTETEILEHESCLHIDK